MSKKELSDIEKLQELIALSICAAAMIIFFMLIVFLK